MVQEGKTPREASQEGGEIIQFRAAFEEEEKNDEKLWKVHLQKMSSRNIDHR